MDPLRAEEVLADADARPGSHQSRGCGIEVFLPEPFREEDRAIVESRVLVDEHVTLRHDVRPQVHDAVVHARFVVDVEVGQHDRFLVPGERVAEPPLAELALLDRAVTADVLANDLEITPKETGRALDGPLVVRLRRGHAFERVVHDELATDDGTDERQVRGRPALPAAALDDHAFRRRWDLEQRHRHREMSLVRGPRLDALSVAVHAPREAKLLPPCHAVARVNAPIVEEEQHRDRERSADVRAAQPFVHAHLELRSPTRRRRGTRLLVLSRPQVELRSASCLRVEAPPRLAPSCRDCSDGP